MQGLTIFNNSEFGELAILEIDGKPYFPATECAEILGYSNPYDAISRHCRGVVKHEGVSKTTNQHGVTTEQKNEKNFIPEGDLYRLITHSKLPSAEKFEKWIFDEVLPSVRKHGAYMTPEKIEEVLLNPDTIIKLATALKDEQSKNKQLQTINSQLQQTITEQEPQVAFAKAVSASDSSILVGDMAKLLRQNGLDIGQNRLFEKLREQGYLCKEGSRYNKPTQYSMDLKIMEYSENAVTRSDGQILVRFTPKITGKGQQYFVSKFGQPTVG